jgi:hypothetical protein
MVQHATGSCYTNLPYDVPHHKATRPHRFTGTSETCSTPPMLVSGVSGAAHRPADPLSVATWPGDMAKTKVFHAKLACFSLRYCP